MFWALEYGESGLALSSEAVHSVSSIDASDWSIAVYGMIFGINQRLNLALASAATPPLAMVRRSWLRSGNIS